MFNRQENEMEKFDWTPYLEAKSERCHKAAVEYFEDIGELPTDRTKYQYCLHHIDPTMKYFDLSRYCEWRPEDLKVLTTSEHIQLHTDFARRNKEYGFLDQLMTLRCKELQYNPSEE